MRESLQPTSSSSSFHREAHAESIYLWNMLRKRRRRGVMIVMVGAERSSSSSDLGITFRPSSRSLSLSLSVCPLAPPASSISWSNLASFSPTCLSTPLWPYSYTYLDIHWSPLSFTCPITRSTRPWTIISNGHFFMDLKLVGVIWL